MIERLFRVSANNSLIKREILCGFTTFLSMMYILFANSEILAETGMPWQGVFVATALSAGICTIFVALFANLPFGMAPGMGLNTIFTYTICMGMGYHWKEALAIVFISGILHIIIMLTALRKSFVNAFPEYLRIATGMGLGMFIAYVGLKNMGLLSFSLSSNAFLSTNGQTIMDGTLIVPGLMGSFSASQFIALVALTLMIVLSALERKTGENYAALPLGILIATFIGIPLKVTSITGALIPETAMNDGLNQIFLSFFGNPGILSIFNEPMKLLMTLMMVCILLMTGILDSIGAMIGLGQIHNAKIFDDEDIALFSRKGMRSKLDKALIANSIGSVVSPIIGVSPSTIYLESVTGIVSGGRTGLTALVTGLLFLLCLPLVGLFQIIPSEAVAPALILAGVSMMTRMKQIEWRNFEESFPAFMTIFVMPITYSVLDGIAVGILCHVIVKISMSKTREVHPLLFVISIVYILSKVSRFI